MAMMQWASWTAPVKGIYRDPFYLCTYRIKQLSWNTPSLQFCIWWSDSHRICSTLTLPASYTTWYLETSCIFQVPVRGQVMSPETLLSFGAVLCFIPFCEDSLLEIPL